MTEGVTPMNLAATGIRSDMPERARPITREIRIQVRECEGRGRGMARENPRYDDNDIREVGGGRGLCRAGTETVDQYQ